MYPALLSGLALAGANHVGQSDAADASDNRDGILTAEEIGTQNLDGVQLVVLSACETGLGKSAGGEGVLGLQRSFQAAGAERGGQPLARGRPGDCRADDRSSTRNSGRSTSRRSMPSARRSSTSTAILTRSASWPVPAR